MSLSGEAMIREKLRKDGDMNGGLFVAQRRGGLSSASRLGKG